MDTKKIRTCSHLLPDPGGEVVREMLDEIERLQGIVDKLPKTADGVPVVPGMVVWPRSDCWIEDEEGGQVELYLRDLASDDSIPMGDDPFGKCYSTRKAAEAGGGK